MYRDFLRLVNAGAFTYYQYWVAALPIILIAYMIKKLGLNYVVEMMIIMGMSGLSYAGILYAFKNEYFTYAMQMILKKIQKKKS